MRARRHDLWPARVWAVLAAHDKKDKAHRVEDRSYALPGNRRRRLHRFEHRGRTSPPRQQQVTVLDDLSAGKEQNLAAVRDKIDFILGTVTDRETLDRACRGADYVLHLAARTSVPRSVKDPFETNRINVDGTLLVLLSARDAGVRRVVFAGSSSVYGDTPTLPKREDMPPAPISPYGVLPSLLANSTATCFIASTGWSSSRYAISTSLDPARIPARPTFRSVIAVQYCHARRRRSHRVSGDGERHSARFHLCRKRCAGEIFWLARTPGIAGMVFNLGTGGRYTLNQTLRLLEKFSGRPANAQYAPPREGDIRDSQADISLAREKLGYNPRIGFEEGLRRTWDWYSSQR